MFLFPHSFHDLFLSSSSPLTSYMLCPSLFIPISSFSLNIRSFTPSTEDALSLLRPLIALLTSYQDTFIFCPILCSVFSSCLKCCAVHFSYVAVISFSSLYTLTSSQSLFPSCASSKSSGSAIGPFYRFSICCLSLYPQNLCTCLCHSLEFFYH